MIKEVTLDTPRFKGTFPLDFDGDPLTSLEWRWIKKISGYLPGTIDEGGAGLDPDLFLSFAVIALYRNGKIRKEEALIVAEALEELPATESTLNVVFDLTEEEEPAEEDPPQPQPEPPPEPPERSSTVSEIRSSGRSSSTISDPLAPAQTRTGIQG